MTPLSFISVDQLIEYMERDKRERRLSYYRFPARFIFLNNFAELKELIGKLISQGVVVVDITERFPFTENPDGWVSPNSILNLLGRLSPEGRYLIIPIWDIVRFYSQQEFTSLFSSISEMENVGVECSNRRIYIPLLGMWNRFDNYFLRGYRRIVEWNPLWKLIGDSKSLNLIFCSFDIPISRFTFTKTSKEFLNLWRTEPEEIILCSSKTLYYYSRNAIYDEFYDIKRIENVRDYITQVLGLKISIPYEERDFPLWQDLIKEIEKRKIDDLNVLIEDYFNVRKLRKEDLLSLWIKERSIFGRWLLKIYVLNNPRWRETYTYQVFNLLKDYSDFEILNLYWLRIFDLERPKKFFDERKLCLRKFYSEGNKFIPPSIEKNLEKRLSTIQKETALNSYITGITPIEKKWILENIDCIEDLETIYPELYYYLRDIEFEDVTEENAWIKEYFKEYKYSKVKNIISQRLISLIEEKSSDKEILHRWSYSFKDYRSLIDTSEDDIIKVCIHGLSVEFLSLFVSLLREKGYNARTILARTEPSSIVDLNSSEDIQYISDLDNLIHFRNSYQYPELLIKEIDAIKNIVDYISGLGDNVLVFSDLSFTDLAYVRDLEITPEKILTPVIYLSKTLKREISYSIEVIDREISVRRPVLRFRISPRIKYDPLVYFNNRRLELDYDDKEDIYILDLKGFNTGMYKFVIKLRGWEEEISVYMKSGIKETEII